MTLIEILMVIAIFSIGILVILGIITNSLSLGWRSRNRTIATMLAKEGLEMMYSLRDTNLDRAQKWGCLNASCSLDMESISTGMFIVDRTMSSGVTVSQIASLSQARLYTTGSSVVIYSHNNTGTPSVFYRYIMISNASILSDDQGYVNSQIKKITSMIEYPQLGGTGRVQLDSFIGLTR